MSSVSSICIVNANDEWVKSKVVPHFTELMGYRHPLLRVTHNAGGTKVPFSVWLGGWNWVLGNEEIKFLHMSAINWNASCSFWDKMTYMSITLECEQWEGVCLTWYPILEPTKIPTARDWIKLLRYPEYE